MGVTRTHDADGAECFATIYVAVGFGNIDLFTGH